MYLTATSYKQRSLTDNSIPPANPLSLPPSLPFVPSAKVQTGHQGPQPLKVSHREHAKHFFFFKGVVGMTG